MGESGINLSLSLGDTPVIGTNVMVLVDELDNEEAALLQASEIETFVCKNVSCQTDFDTFGTSSLPLIFCGLFSPDGDAMTQCDIPMKVNVGVSTVSCDMLNEPAKSINNNEPEPFKLIVPMSRHSRNKEPPFMKKIKVPDDGDCISIIPPASIKKENIEEEGITTFQVSTQKLQNTTFSVAGLTGVKLPTTAKRKKVSGLEDDVSDSYSFSEDDANSWENPFSSVPEKKLKTLKTFNVNSENLEDDDPQLMAVKKCLENIKMEDSDDMPVPLKVSKKVRVNLLQSALQQDIKIEGDDEWITDDEVDDEPDDMTGQLEQNMKDDEQRTCKECNLTFNSHLLLIEHTESNHVANICEYCGFTTTFKNKLDRHVVKHTKEKAFICDMCGKQYSQKQNLRDHISRYHRDEDSSNRYPYSCEHCKRMYRNESNLIKHMEKDSGKCNTCGEVVACSGILFQHKKNHVTCSCEFCDKVFQSKSALQIHVNIKHKDKGLQCSMCPKKFLFPSYLKLHFANAHSQTSPQFKCQECGFCAVTESYLKSHMTRMHSNADRKKYMCQVCKKAFRSNARLIEHTRIHTGERPFSCPVCFKTFYSQSNLYSHERTVHGRLNNYGTKNVAVDTDNSCVMKKVFSSCYQCQSCSATFNNKKKLNAHMESEHNVIPEDVIINDELVSNLNDMEVAPMHLEMASETIVQSEEYDTGGKTVAESPVAGDDGRSSLSLPAYVVPPNVNLVEIDGVQYHVIRNNI